MSDILAGLNPAQREAVGLEGGPALVLAGPGSGKTRVLTHRVAWLIEQGIHPYRLMAVTFTNKAAREMRSRIETLLGGRLRGLTIGTFHATCARILRREAEHTPLSPDYLIYDTDDQLALVKRAVADLGLDDKRFQPPKVLNSISMAKNELITPDIYRADTYFGEVVGRVYERYMRLLIESNAADFDDLLLRAVLLFQEHPDVLGRYQTAYDHILVDEFQDTNSAQYVLVRALADEHRSIFCVGDEDQSIYRFRGADYRNVMRFRHDFPDARVILLEQNYRSTQTILDAAQEVINQNPHRTPKRLFTHKEGGPQITQFEAYDEHEEAQFVVDTIATLVATGEAEPGECALMYRTNAQSRSLEEAFIRAGLPYQLVNATRFYNRREIRDVLAYLRLIHNPDDTLSLRRIINMPPRGIGTKTIAVLEGWAARQGLSSGAALDRLREAESDPAFTNRAFGLLRNFAEMLAGWREVSHDLDIAELLNLVLDEAKYHDYINDGTDEGRDRWENVLELRNVAAEYAGASLAEFLEGVALVADVDGMAEEVNAPTLLTLHSAKGLEFRVVFIVGLEDGLLPHQRSFDDPEAMAEERRLMYVGMTRAKERLYLVYAFRRMAWGESSIAIPSRFLADIPQHLLTGGRLAGAGTIRRAETWTKDGASSDDEPRFKPGQRVLHPKFGEGTVIESRPSGDDEEVSVVFEEGGLKRLIAGFANLSVIDG
jgi:DNA helicase-2/ATP-dependent DNA helicase PcrA